MTVFLPVWNSHCTRVRFTVIVSYSDGFAVNSCPFFCLQRRVAKVASGLFYCWSLLRNKIVATNLQKFTLCYGSSRDVALTKRCGNAPTKTSHYDTASNSFQSKTWKRCWNAVLTRFRPTTPLGRRRFVAWDCWTHTSWQVMQRDSDMLIAVSHVHSYFAKRSMCEPIATLPLVWKILY